MMNGRGFNGRGFDGRGFDSGSVEGFNSCIRNGFGTNGFSMLIGIGVILLIAILLYMIVRKNREKQIKQSVFSTLNMKYVQGDITEEEYLRRKDILNK